MWSNNKLALVISFGKNKEDGDFDQKSGADMPEDHESLDTWDLMNSALC